MRSYRLLNVVFGALLASVIFALPAGAISIPFDCLSQNSALDCSIAEAQLSAEVSDLGAGQVRITFSNEGGEAVVFTRFVFQGESVSGIAAIQDDPSDVDFEIELRPHLPAGQTAASAFDAQLGISAAPPSPHTGVDPGESVAVVLDLAPGFDFAELSEAIVASKFRIGAKAQAFDSEGSETLLNQPVPEPGTALALGLGLALLARRSGRC